MQGKELRAVTAPGHSRGRGFVLEIEESGQERRRKPRFNAELSCDIRPGDAELVFPGERLECRTRDLSETGVGVVAGSIYVGYTCVVDEGRPLLARLALPAGEVEMEATTAHYIRLDKSSQEPRYLIGLRIISMTDHGRALYNDYLEELSRSE
jgi:c-di-GMP-binding flagellar brake protein YcgR